MARLLASIHLFYPKHCCGSESMMLHIMKYLITKGHQCRVILHQYNGEPYNYEGIEVFPATGRVDAYEWSQVIFTHLDFTQYTILMANEAKRPLVHFIHNDITYDSIMNNRYGQYVCFNSNWIREKIKYPHPSIVLHPPCSIEYYNVNNNPINNEHITLISLNERKGGWLFHKIAEAMPDRKFLGVVGSYDNSGALKLSQQQIIDMMPPNVEIVPNSPDILATYKRTRLLLMPSDYESWGRTATEAMCNGIPVICTPTPGLKENCGDAGTYVGHLLNNTEPGDPMVHQGTVDEWVAAIRQFDDAEYYNKKSLACRQRAGELDPLKELQELEDFILNARF